MPDQPQQAAKCCAHGCPLQATIFDSTIGAPTNGRCRYHDAASPKHWPFLTQTFQERAWRREDIEPALRAIGLLWQEPVPHAPAKQPAGYEAFKRWWALYSAGPPEPHHPVSEIRCKSVVGTFQHVGALLEHVIEISEAELEAIEERLAIQAEGQLR